VAIGAALLAALLAAAPAGAHVLAQPPYVTQNEVDTISLDAPNERAAPMTGFVVVVPAGIELVHAHGPAPPWTATFSGSKATWSGSSLAPGAWASFGVVLEAKAEPGSVELRAEQLYGDGSVVRWPVSLTVLPSKDTSSYGLRLAAVIGLIGLLVVVVVVVLAWRVRTRSTAD
jgi:uncharacterized protein YcnI